MILGILLITLVAAVSLSGQGVITGAVSERRDGRLLPLPHTAVSGVSVANPELGAFTATDREGRYRLENVPNGQVLVTVERRGFYVASAAGRESTEAIIDCSPRGECGSADFEVARTNVLEGYTVGPYSEPISWVRISVVPSGEDPPRSRGLPGRGEDFTDDQGYFRLTGLRPGPYDVHFRYRGRVPAIETELITEPVPIKITEGGEHPLVYANMRAPSATVFQMAGVVEGVSVIPDSWNEVSATPIRSGERGYIPPFSTQVRPDNARFSLQNLPEGEYHLQYISRKSGAWDIEAERINLGTIHVDRSLAEVVLRPKPPSGVSGQVRFESVPPRNVSIDLLPLTASVNRVRFVVRGPDYRFERRSIGPGRYELRARSEAFYVKSPRELSIVEGSVEEITIVASGKFARVVGQVTKPQTYAQQKFQAADRFGVALRASETLLVTETDQNGQFSFPRVVPAQYRIGAWADLTVNPHNESVWRNADSLVRNLSVDPGDEVEVTLGVVQ